MPWWHTLGTKSAGFIDWGQILLKNAQTLRINAMEERDHLESNGFGDQLNEMQATSWSVIWILNGRFNMDMCFLYRDDEEMRLCNGAKKQLCIFTATNQMMKSILLE